MRKLLALLAVTAVLAPTPALADPPVGREPKVTLCHATGSETNPYVEITVAAAAAAHGHYPAGHQNDEDIIPTFTHGGTVYPAKGDQSILLDGCRTGSGSSEVAPVQLDARLSAVLVRLV